MKTLKKLCSIPGTSGDESTIAAFILNYIKKNKSTWKVKPGILCGAGFQDCIVLIFGKPRTAVYAHIDTIGFTVGYDQSLIKVGGPKIQEADLFGVDEKGKIKCKLIVNDEGEPTYQYKRKITRGTALSFVSKFREDEKFIQSSYLDNRLGVWNALKLAETLEDGVIAFTTYEEHGGGTAGFLAEYLYDNYGVRQALISDITWVTKGVRHGKGVAVSMRDKGIPRRSFVERILKILEQTRIKHQIEVESAGGSDGSEIQRSSRPIDWCFIGAPEDNVHSANEKVHKQDIKAMADAYRHLMKKL